MAAFKAVLRATFDRAFLRSVASVGTLMFSGDAVAQQVEGSSSRSLSKAGDLSIQFSLESVREWNVSRSMRMATIGCCSAGPISHITYVLSAWFLPGTSWLAICKKLVLVQLINTPISMSCTFTLATLLAGGEFADAAQKIRVDLPRTMVSSWCFWTPIVGINMRMVPVPYQATVGGVAWAIWNVYLSYVANLKSVHVSCAQTA